MGYWWGLSEKTVLQAFHNTLNHRREKKQINWLGKIAFWLSILQDTPTSNLSSSWRNEGWWLFLENLTSKGNGWEETSILIIPFSIDQWMESLIIKSIIFPGKQKKGQWLKGYMCQNCQNYTSEVKYRRKKVLEGSIPLWSLVNFWILCVFLL